MFYDDPWPHYVTDDYFGNKLFDKCSRFANNIQCDMGQRNQVWIKSHEPMYQQIVNAFIQYCRIMGMTVDHTKHTIQVEFNVCGVGYNYDIIHTDAVNKVFSTVVYLSQDGSGTPLYRTKDKQSLAKTIEWKPNRALSFFRSDHSWHDFGCGKFNEPRRTLTLVVNAN